MFIDNTIVNIFRRSTNTDTQQLTYMLHQYALTIMEAIAYAGIDYYIRKEEMPTYNLKQIQKVLKKVFDEIKTDKELLERVNEEIDRINLDLLKNFMKIASPGDVLYLQVYLATVIRDFKAGKKKGSALNFLKNLTQEPKMTKLNSELKL